jgi:hypothetical protein
MSAPPLVTALIPFLEVLRRLAVRHAVTGSDLLHRALDEGAYTNDGDELPPERG